MDFFTNSDQSIKEELNLNDILHKQGRLDNPIFLKFNSQNYAINAKVE